MFLWFMMSTHTVYVTRQRPRSSSPQPRGGATVRTDGAARGEPSSLELSRVGTEEGKAKPHLKTKGYG